MKAIRAKCLECSNDNRGEVSLCTIPDCPLYPFRLGHNPNIKKRELTEEQRQEMSDRLKRMRNERRLTNERKQGRDSESIHTGATDDKMLGEP